MHIEKSGDLRININFNSSAGTPIEVQGVRTYGKAWGRFLKCFNLASTIKTDEGKTTYVNTTSLIKHLAESWAKQPAKQMDFLETPEQRLAAIPSLIKAVKARKTLEKNNLNESSLTALFEGVWGASLDTKYLPERFTTKAWAKKQFAPKPLFNRETSHQIPWENGVVQSLVDYMREAQRNNRAKEVNWNEAEQWIARSFEGAVFQNGNPTRTQIKETLKQHWEETWNSTIGVAQVNLNDHMY